MHEDVADDLVATEESPQPTPFVGAPLILIMFACIAGIGSTFLSAKSPIDQAESFNNWLCFGERILGDILLAGAILSVAIVVSLFLPRVGLFVERLVLRSNRTWFLAVCGLFAFVSSALLCATAWGRLPHIQDEVAMVFQAKVLASGRLFAEVPPLREFFDQEYVVQDGPRWYGKYFLGSSLVMVPGVWMGIVWLISPLFAPAVVVLTYVLGRALLGDKIARVATVLMAISPFRMSLFAMMMAHPACMLALVIVALGVLKIVQDPRRWTWALTAGAGLGFAINTRPLTAGAVGAVMGAAAMVVMPWRKLRFKTLVAFAIPVFLSVAIYFAYNQALTGNPRLTPFEQWSPKDHLGFGPDVGAEYWYRGDRGHTFRKALLHNTYFSLDALGVNLTGMGYTTLGLLAIAPFVCRRKLLGWTLAAMVLALMVGYFFYLTPSVFAGQVRYWSEVMPAMMLLIAISFASVRAAVPRFCRFLGITPAVRTGRAACWLAALALAVIGVPKAYADIVDFLDAEIWARGNRLRDMAEEKQLTDAIVFISTRHYRDTRISPRTDSYGTGFVLNDPELKNSVIYARDLGPAKDAELLKLFPGRRAYWINLDLGTQAEFVEFSKWADLNSIPSSQQSASLPQPRSRPS